ncbi:uncharacterized protein [Porites lutea]|uniref:uncharacterized protein n=1 Tax=Porites lutea TaxID=51062 RepID=UPI003CC51B4B
MSAEPEQLRKIFVGGLNRRTSEESLKEYFSLWGNIVDCVIMREGKNGPSRGFGFVTFDSSQAVDDCLKVKRHELDNWEIEPKRSVPRGEVTSRTRKIFVGGLASTATESDVEEYFGKLCAKFGVGKVLDVDLKRDKENPNRLRGFAFVTFDSEEVVDKICSITMHQIKMKQCEVKRAESQAAMRKKEEEEFRVSGRTRESRSSLDTPSFGGFPMNWGLGAGFGGMNQGFGNSGGRGNFGGGGGSGSFGGGSSMGGGGGNSMGMGMGGLGMGMGGFNSQAAAAALLSGGFNPAAFASFNPASMGMGSGFGFSGMGFGGFNPGFFGGFGGFGPGSFGGGGAGGGVGGSVGGSGFASLGGGGYGGGGRSHSSSSSYEKENFGDSPYGMADLKGSSVGDRNPTGGMSVPGGSSGGGYDSMSNPLAAAYGHGNFPGGFGGFPGGMGDWSQFPGGVGGGSLGAGAGGASADYQIGNYSQVNSSYGPTSRINNRGASGVDKNNRGYRPY